MNKEIDLEPRYFEAVKNILNNRLKNSRIKVYVFGSRVNGKTKAASDIDLALDGGVKLDYFKVIAPLKEDFEESNIKYSVDIIDLNTITDSFKKHIISDLTELEYQIVR